MNKLSAFLLGTITGAIALGVTACVCESSFSSSSEEESTDADDEINGSDSSKGTLQHDSALMVR